MNHALLTFLIFLVLNTSAQTNAYVFIEPNISFAYDSSKVKVTNTYSNSFYNKEAVDFTFYKDRKSVIHVTAQPPLSEIPDVRFIDSIMVAGIKEIRSENKKDMQVIKYDSVIRHINSFSCVGYILYDASHKSYLVNIMCNHLSGNDATEVHYTSITDSSLETGYKRLNSFLPGFTSYSQSDIQREEELIRNKYKVVIKKKENLPEKLKSLPFTFWGIAEITPTPVHKVHGAMINLERGGKQLFSPNKENKIEFECRDENATGVIKKSGSLVLLNSFGKKVEIPFTFEYTK